MVSAWSKMSIRPVNRLGLSANTNLHHSRRHRPIFSTRPEGLCSRALRPPLSRSADRRAYDNLCLCATAFNWVVAAIHLLMVDFARSPTQTPNREQHGMRTRPRFRKITQCLQASCRSGNPNTLCVKESPLANLQHDQSDRDDSPLQPPDALAARQKRCILPAFIVIIDGSSLECLDCWPTDPITANSNLLALTKKLFNVQARRKHRDVRRCFSGTLRFRDNGSTVCFYRQPPPNDNSRPANEEQPGSGSTVSGLCRARRSVTNYSSSKLTKHPEPYMAHRVCTR